MAFEMLMHAAKLRSKKHEYKEKQIDDIHPKFRKTRRSTSENISVT